MGEKSRGLFPGSVCFNLNREETETLLRHQGEWEGLSEEQKALIDSSDIEAVKGKVAELETMIRSAGIELTTLYD